MKQQEVFKKIGGIIREINEQYEYLETAGGVFNDLELELLVANSHFLTDHIEILKKLNAHLTPAPIPVAKQPEVVQPEITESATDPEPSYFKPVMSEQPVIEEPEAIEEPAAHTIEFEIGGKAEQVEEAIPEPVIELEEAESEPETIRHELTLEDIGGDWDEEDDEAEDIALAPEPVEVKAAEPEAVKPAPEPIVATPEVKTEPTPVAAATNHTQIMVDEEQVITLNQRMSAQMNQGRMSDQLVGQPISDLKSAITLNDKMLYVKDLFNGYSLAYSEAIDLLNRMKTFEEAQTFLKASYATKNNWGDKQATADKFYALLQRRYTP